MSLRLVWGRKEWELWKWKRTRRWRLTAKGSQESWTLLSWRVSGRLGSSRWEEDWLLLGGLRFEVWFCWGDLMYTQLAFLYLEDRYNVWKWPCWPNACIQRYFEHFLPRNILRHNWNCKNTSNKIIQILHQTTTNQLPLTQFEIVQEWSRGCRQFLD